MLKGILDEWMHNCSSVCELELYREPMIMYVLTNVICSSSNMLFQKKMLSSLGNLFMKMKIEFMVITSVFLFPTRAIWHFSHKTSFAYVSWLRFELDQILWPIMVILYLHFWLKVICTDETNTPQILSDNSIQKKERKDGMPKKNDPKKERKDGMPKKHDPIK